MKVFHLGINVKKNSKQDLKIEAKFAEGEKKTNSFKISCKYVKVLKKNLIIWNK